ncbi:MAG: response regulator [Oscillospiraceae bacterium]|jgi:PleD family two-component response regulator|nr:response regulator [Oscillospiraceae bacterium]
MNDSKKNSVLIVDDENLNIMVLTHILEPDYTVYAAKDGASAIKAAEKYLPDVILLDIMMPEMNGYTVITELKKSEKTKDIPVIFVTVLSYTDDEEKGLTLGAADFITKPFSSEVVKLRVKNQIKIINQMNLIIEKEIAERNSKAKIDFMSQMSHDMLTPMNVIMGMTFLALDEEDNSEDVTKYLNEINTSSQNLLKLINDLLGIKE